jgi:alpha-L-arabinofuranosidase
VQRTLEYDGSIWIRHLSGPAELSISIRKRNTDDRILAEAKVGASSSDWTRYAFHLTLKTGDVYRLEPADFVISLSHDAQAEDS